MNKSKKNKVLSFGAAFLLLTGIIGVRGIEKDNSVSKEGVIIEETQPTPLARYQFYYYNDTVNIDDSIYSLGITYNKIYPFESYRFLRFVDNDHRENFAIANVYVEYVLDENKNVVNTIYNYYDVFNNMLLLSTTDKKDIKSFNSDVILRLMDYGNLLELKECVISKGLDQEYVNGVMGSDIKNKELSTYDIARYYVLLVRSDERFENNKSYTITMG